jgi:hypothetical protein
MSGIKDYLEFDIKRPRRNCTQKQENHEEKYEFSDSESDIETPDNSHDEDFTLDKPKKVKKKKKKVPKDPKERKINREQIPSYDSVISAQKALEDRLAGRSAIQYNDRYVYDSDDSELDEAWYKDDPEPEPETEIIEEQPPPEPVKKKKIVIRPWNPQWYQINH